MMGLFGTGTGFGIEVGQRVIRAARIKGGSGGVRRIDMVGSAEMPEGLMLDSFTEPNITDLPAFVETLKRLLASMRHRGGGIGVALPDFVSRVSVLDFETVQAKQEETERMIRWRLKKLLPFDVDLATLRHQYLGRFRTGDKDQHRFLVSIIKADILRQYEAAFKEAGVRTARVGMSSFALWNLYHDHIAREVGGLPNFALMGISGTKMTVIVFDQGAPHFLRLKDLGRLDADGPDGGPGTRSIVKELSASLTFYKENFGRAPVTRVFVTGDFAGLGAAADEAGTAVQAEVSLLDIEKTLQGGAGLSFYGAACGAALEP